MEEDTLNKNSKSKRANRLSLAKKTKVNWKEIFAQLDAAGVPDDFLTPEDRNQGEPRNIDHLFDDWPDDPPD